MNDEVIYRTDKELQESLAYWQYVLGLRDWKIKATLANQNDLDSPDHQAEISIYEEARHALVWIVKAEQRSKLAAFPQDDENSLVHELLHIHFEPLGKPRSESGECDPRLTIATEQAIHAITDALLRLRRGKRDTGRDTELENGESEA